MNLNQYLPKYKKSWVKENCFTPIDHENGGIYLVVKDRNPLIHRGEIVHKYLSQFDNEHTQGAYFFELFKYLKKFQEFSQTDRGWMPRQGLRVDATVLRPEIKKHLLKKYNEKVLISKKTPSIRMDYIVSYSKLIDHCFNTLIKGQRVEISLVIQKKIGYKYYQNVIYS